MIASKTPLSLLEADPETDLLAPSRAVPLSPDPSPGSYRGVIVVLFGVSLLGAAVAYFGGMRLEDPVLLDAAVTLGISAGVLAGVAVAQRERRKALQPAETIELTLTPNPPESLEPLPLPPSEPEEDAEKPRDLIEAVRTFFVQAMPRLRDLRLRLADRLPHPGVIRSIAFATAAFGVLATTVLRTEFYMPTPLMAGIGVALCLAAAGLAATVVRYFAVLDRDALPEAVGLCRGARVVAWILVLAAASIGLGWFGQFTILRVLHFAILAANIAVCISLFRQTWRQPKTILLFPLDLGVIEMLGSRDNLVASILDAAERQLGIDLRSTWALTVLRSSVEPLVITLFLLGWLSTSLTVVGLQEIGLVERLGVPQEGKALQPGLHVHLPWPVDRVFRVPLQRVQSLTVGHEGEEGGGPEDVLWARKHAASEYTLLLGNGRDLITIDAGVAYRVTDPRAWRYHTQNPEDALKSIAYRAVMRNTVNKTLQEALSENVALLTTSMRKMVQEDADALGLGITVEAFTVGGMHPPVPVADAYQAVISAEVGKVTSIVRAQVFRNQNVPAAEATAVTTVNAARAQGEERLAEAAGQAWSFRTLESQFRSAPDEFRFRRRLETLERGLANKRYTVVDFRFQRDGGELWLTP
jgi:regulator of protease activity HflC (stomatin/prohibitin superfamily)